MNYDRKYYVWYKIKGEKLYLKIRQLSDSLSDESWKFYCVVVGKKKWLNANKWNWLRAFNAKNKMELKRIIIQ